MKACVSLICLLLTPLTIYCQLYNNSIVHIEEDVILHSPYTLINKGFIQNNGEWTTTNGWSNHNIYQGVGSVVFAGAHSKVILNSGQPINRLSVTGGGRLILNDDLPIESLLELDDGLIDASGAKLILQDGCQVAGGNDESYVDGFLYRKGAGALIYPIGSNGQYLPVEILQSSGSDNVTAIKVNGMLSALDVDFTFESFNAITWSIISSGSDNGYIDIQLPEAEQPGRIISRSGGEKFKLVEPIDNMAVNGRLSLKDQEIGAVIINPIRDGALYISTSLSPSAIDEKNRCVFVYGGSLSNDRFSFKVYNRWGMQVFASGSAEEMRTTGWNGVDSGSGKMVEGGAYPFQLQAVKADGTIVREQGNINVVR